MPGETAVTVARRALALLDLTNLDDTATPASIDALCARAVGPAGTVAAVCVYPRFVAQAKRLLAGTGVKVATVVNFPAGGEDLAAILDETAAALADGADEIDHVMAWRTVLDGRPGFAETQIHRVKAAIGGRAKLKVILETGEIKDPDLIRKAAEIALGAGADFLKTSTGKVKVNASVEATRILLQVIKDAGRTDVGVKPAGGIRTLEDAADYLATADSVMGAGWARPSTFRFGASSLLDSLVAVIEGRRAEDAGGRY